MPIPVLHQTDSGISSEIPSGLNITCHMPLFAKEHAVGEDPKVEGLKPSFWSTTASPSTARAQKTCAASRMAMWQHVDTKWIKLLSITLGFHTVFILLNMVHHVSTLFLFSVEEHHKVRATFPVPTFFYMEKGLVLQPHLRLKRSSLPTASTWGSAWRGGWQNFEEQLRRA